MTIYTLADLTRLCGAKRRTVQLLAEAGALIAESLTDRQGSGTHRMFTRDEAIVCVILSRFADWNLPIGVAGTIRSRILTKQVERELIEKAISGDETRIVLSLYSDFAVGLLYGENEKVLSSPMRELGADNESMISVFITTALSALRDESKA